MASCTPLTTLAQFREAKSQEVGFIVVRDQMNPNRIHRPDCHSLTVEHFVRKVQDSLGRHGDYHFCLDYGAALRLVRAEWRVRDAGPCLLPHCRSLRDLPLDRRS